MKRNVKVPTAITAGAPAIAGVLAVGPVTADTGGGRPTPDRTVAQSLTADSTSTVTVTACRTAEETEPASGPASSSKAS